MQKLHQQFQELRAERKTNELQLDQILNRLQGLQFGDRIKEVQEALRKTEEALALTKQELEVEKSSMVAEERIRMTKLHNENFQLRGRLATLTVMLSSLNERISQLQFMTTGTSASFCCQFLLNSCCPLKHHH